MTLPSFLGIGVPRAGTTWLHQVLAGHPDVFLPERRKEIRFFDRHFQRGLAWYEDFFCPSDEAHRYRGIGEISPQYLYDERCPERIAATLSDPRLLVMLRHPVDRAYSNYGFVVQRRNYHGSFEEFLAARPDVLARGVYSPHIKRYLRYFDRSRMLAIVFEDAVRDEGHMRRCLASFLDLSLDAFPTAPGRVNPSTVPRFGVLSSVAVKVGRKLRRHSLESLVDLGGRLGVRRALTKGDPLPPLEPGLRSELSVRFEDEFGELERTLHVDLRGWMSDPARHADSAR